MFFWIYDKWIVLKILKQKHNLKVDSGYNF